jgi:hypothetical protein
MKTILSVMTMLALTFSLVTAGVKEDPKKVSEKKESACCAKEAKVSKTAKTKDCCASMSKADKMKCGADAKCDQSMSKSDKMKCGTDAKCDHMKAEKVETDVKPTNDKN